MFNKANSSKMQEEPCGYIKFDLTFDTPGTYEYILKETTNSGDGWTTDDRTYRVIVTVVDDGLGNLIASVEYPDGDPQFLNTYSVKPVDVVICATKEAIGAELLPGKFEFGLFDEKEVLVAMARNEANGYVK